MSLSILIVATALAVLAYCCTAGHPGTVAASDTVSAQRPLRGDDTVVSAKAKFELGLFSPGSSGRFYLGIWYKNVPGKTVIWVGNRENPLSSVASAELRVSTNDGNLELVGLSQSSASLGVVWSSNLSSSTVSSPTPGSNDPAPGMFTDTVDHNGSSEFFYLWNGSRSYWRSGVWTGRTFANIPQAAWQNVIFNQTYVETPAYRRLTHVLYDNATIERLVLDFTGQTNQYLWLAGSQRWQLIWSAPTVPCDVYALCGAFGICNQRRQPPCQCPPGFAPAAERDWGLSERAAAVRRQRVNRRGGHGFECTEAEDAAQRPSTFFPVWASARVAEGDTAAVADPRLHGNVSEGELERACRVACWCIQDQEAHRPTMAQVLQALEGVVDVYAPPVPQTLQHLTSLS
ncbi:unnamed protein product [Urochloa decumbens]|uniref:non-specific serine/threonine protein kinase n=1 Tax=Urochloa decumbens TaxID=240449 RepID=A0ABC8YXG9_9POAL